MNHSLIVSFIWGVPDLIRDTVRAAGRVRRRDGVPGGHGDLGRANTDYRQVPGPSARQQRRGRLAENSTPHPTGALWIVKFSLVRRACGLGVCARNRTCPRERLSPILANRFCMTQSPCQRFPVVRCAGEPNRHLPEGDPPVARRCEAKIAGRSRTCGATTSPTDPRKRPNVERRPLRALVRPASCSCPRSCWRQTR